MKKILLIPVLLLWTLSLFAQVEAFPTNWYTGMKWNKVQILLRSQNTPLTDIQFSYPGIRLDSIQHFANPHYAALNITIGDDVVPGSATITLGKKKKTTIKWPVLARRNGNGTNYAQGVTSKDLIYLIMPDRFSNGDPDNDRVKGMRDQSLRRDTVFNRHGGDLKGVLNKLDYLADLGVTAIWLNPVLENDMPDRTEHGYAITNHYKVDPRLGGDAAYEQLVNAAHAKGIKIIQDAIYNHVGLYHFLMQDQPDSTWFHRWPAYTQTNYKDQTIFDPYAAASDRKIMTDGWFTEKMPDLNHGNIFVEKFLIQHALWCMEKFGIDGWRVDTYAYNDLDFMNRCNAALYADFPKVSIFGETWVHGVINQAFFGENNLDLPFKSNLQATTDFQTLLYGIQPAVNEKFGWTEGVNRLYSVAAQDLVYKDPMRQVIFLDNHDLSRFYSVVGEDMKKYKVAMAWLMTFRGIPQMYYGSEIAMAGVTHPSDGYVRLDFPGGWNNDAANKFSSAGRSEKENDIFNYIRTLANYRKNSSAITTGKMMQYLPKDGLYVYFRYDDNQKVMCVMNTDTKTRKVELKDYPEQATVSSTAKNIITGNDMGNAFNIGPMEMYVLEIK